MCVLGALASAAAMPALAFFCFVCVCVFACWLGGPLVRWRPSPRYLLVLPVPALCAVCARVRVVRFVASPAPLVLCRFFPARSVDGVSARSLVVRLLRFACCARPPVLGVRLCLCALASFSFNSVRCTRYWVPAA